MTSDHAGDVAEIETAERSRSFGEVGIDAAPTTAPESPRPARSHDLDALRGFAMLLGVALHASLSFFPGFWVAVDSKADSDSRFDDFFHAVHGFRMPLFFLLSGFFTMMLWRRRGGSRLVRHRLKRIALPFAIFVLPMGLLMTWTVEEAIDAGVEDFIEQNDDIWAAVFFGNEDAVAHLLDGEVDVNAQNPEGGDTPLHTAAFTGDADMAALLLDRGADPNFLTVGGRPVDYAVFFGSAEVADLLVAAGADDSRPTGGDWTDIEFWADGAGQAEQIEEELGLDPWVGSGWWKNLNHLWFLWFLLWLLVGFVIVALAADRILPQRTTPAAWSGWLMWALIPLTLLPQLQMGDGGELRVFGPDTSTNWLPIWHVLAFYAVFFAFGALLYARPNRQGGQLVDTIGRWWPILLPVTPLVFVVAHDVTFDSEASWTAASIGQVAFAWLAIVTLMGLFHTLLAKERRGIRYLSDSAYWLYLAHLPLVIWAQIWIRNWDLPATVKFIGLTTTVTIMLLISYQLFVRYTPLGTLLNGQRTRPDKSEIAEPESMTSTQSKQAAEHAF
jgi:peptidoglycan/LPS O-acetylase OafA/YrhL